MAVDLPGADCSTALMSAPGKSTTILGAMFIEAPIEYCTARQLHDNRDVAGTVWRDI
jgi:hypothetical protein